MTRHVKTLMKKTFHDDSESETGTLAKAVYDTLAGKTFVGMSVTRYGQNVLAVLVYDD